MNNKCGSPGCKLEHMTVGELVEKLKTFKPEMVVVMSMSPDMETATVWNKKAGVTDDVISVSTGGPNNECVLLENFFPLEDYDDNGHGRLTRRNKTPEKKN